MFNKNLFYKYLVLLGGLQGSDPLTSEIPDVALKAFLYKIILCKPFSCCSRIVLFDK